MTLQSNMIGQQLGSFQIDAKIGAGAMGVVYRATHVKTGRIAAVKVITADQTGKGNTAERFEREAEILQQFKHPNIVRFLAVGRSRGVSYFAMEYVQGTTLEDVLEKREFLPWREVVDLGFQLCEALQYAHERGIVHRDLKPSNIMINEEGQVKLTDFGIAKDLDATALTATGRTLGTAAYMAPEQIRGTPEVSHKTDLYALGCLLYQMLTGQTPFRGAAIAVLMNCHLNEPPPRPSGKNPEVPRALDDLVIKLMAKGPADRPWDAEAVLTILNELRGQLDRGETIKMVFGPSGAGAALPRAPGASVAGVAIGESSIPAGNGTSAATRPRKKKRKKREGGWEGSTLGTIGLAAALVAALGLLGYLLWPASADTLIAQARPLMASSRSEDWDAAERRYLAELDRRFPDHDYASEVSAFRDRVALNRARRRANVLENALVSKTRGDWEGDYIQATTKTQEAVHAGAEEYAAKIWEDTANRLERSYPDEPEARGWVLLAREKAEELRKLVEKRTREVEDLLAEATGADASNRPEVARNIRQRVLKEYGGYPYLGHLLNLARQAVEPPEEPSPEAPPPARELEPREAPTPAETPET